MNGRRVAGETPEYRLFIANEWVDAQDGGTFETFDPFSGLAWATVARATAPDVDRAVAAALRALAGPWSRLSASDRGVLLTRLGDLIERDADALAEIEGRDNGKLRAEVRGQVAYVARYFRYYGGLADKIQGSVVPIDKPNVFAYTRLEPVGVVATITPWNSSLLLTAWKIAPALAAGNAIVAKPSEHTPVSLLELAKLFVEAGFPPGVFNVLTGFGEECGEALVTHKDVAMVAFTGGDEGGRHVNQLAAKSLKRVTLELGGKSPHIVFDDADLERAANGVITGIFSAAGQTCMAGSRLLLQESIHDAFVERLVSITRRARLGDPARPDVQVGPIATRPQFDKVIRYIEIAGQEGAICVCGGRARTGEGYGAGQFVEPTIFTGVSNRMRIAQEEVFGPVLAVLKFTDESDAVRIANDIRFGLAAGVWTKSLHRAMVMSERLKAGTVWINNYRSTSFTMPFGGYKDSGRGREGGVDAIREFLEVKSVWMSSDLDMPDPFVRKY
jgi:aldehyde dehydrogenase (NAD+)